MDIRDIKPAREFATRFGIKAIVYGAAGTSKTPSINSAPRPLLLAIEPGLRSMNNSNVPTYVADTSARINDFFKWFHSSKDASKYDTLAIDSGSEWAEVLLAEKMKTNKHGLKAYGEMAEDLLLQLQLLYKMPQKHVILLCKQGMNETGSNVIQKEGSFVVEKTYQAAPYFPGKELGIKVPHMFDCIWQATTVLIQGQKQLAVRTVGSADVYARTRGGLEAGIPEYAPFNYEYLFRELMK